MTKSNKAPSSAKKAAHTEIKNLAGSRVEISAVIPAESWGKSRAQAIKNLNQNIKIDGFRKGNIPENVLIAKIGEMAILEEMAEISVPEAYVDALQEHDIDAIGRPSIQVTKIAAGSPLEFKAVTAVVPTVTLPDYRAIASKINKTADPSAEGAVSEKELEDAILRLRKAHAPHDGHDHDKMTPEEHDKAVTDSMPALSDEFVKTLGEFDNVADFKDKLTRIIASEKVNSAREKRRIMIADELAQATKIDLPDILIESELDRTQAQFTTDISRMGATLEAYLSHAKKTIEEIRKEWRPHAEKKACIQLILNNIAKAEDIAPTADEISAEVDHIVKTYEDADRGRAEVYAETVLSNEKVFDFLENIKP